MKLQILVEAEDELNAAIAYYENVQAGLGLRLKQEARATLRWILDHFDLPPLRPKGYRRVNLKVFPYYVAYFTFGDTIWILAMAHSHRRPEYWMSRKSEAE